MLLKFIAIGLILQLFGCNVSSQLLRADVMNLGVFNPETKHYEKIQEEKTDKSLLGGDDHDMIPHQSPLLGGGDHDMKPHGQHLLGQDGHDHAAHGPILGGDDHDKKTHRQHILGQDGHDHVAHGLMLGGDDHDKKPHRQHILGQDGHDHVAHGPMFGRGDHDKKPHRQHILGQDGHDHVAHGPMLGRGDHDKKPHGQHILGQDGHDHVAHGPMLGGGDHDKKPHRQHLLGQDGHDHAVHIPLLGRGDHDLKPHGVHIIGGDDHDRVPHHRQNLGRDDHDKKPHGPWLGGGDHDKKPHGKGMNVLTSFRKFIQEHGKQYTGQAEFRKRFSIFRQNLQRIRQLIRSERGSATYGVTKFSDLSASEYSAMLGFRPSYRRPSLHRTVVASVSEDVQLPASFDWRDHGAVTPVKNQGMCGSCWAFSTTGNVEGQWAIKKSQLVSLSEQELVDCDPEDHGCEGGLPENAYDAIMKLGGLETEDEYPYNGHDGTCHMEAQKARVQVNGSVELPQDENQLARWLLKNGPISIGINAMPLQFYTGGVSHPLRFLCNPKNLDHGVLIVGFGTHTTKYLHRVQPYWLIKNSWGSTWGEQGYFRVYRGDGTCGVNMMATSAIVSESGGSGLHRSRAEQIGDVLRTISG